MRMDITCALDGIGVQDLDDRIYVEDVQEDTAIDQKTADRAGYGLFPLNEGGHQSKTITVKVMIKERNRAARMQVARLIQGWATKGWLTSNMFPGLRIYVFCNKMPQVSAFEVSDRLEMKFIAYGEAYWQEITPLTINQTSAVSSNTHSITPRGTQKCFLEAQIAPSSGTLTSVTITVDSQSLALSGLSVTASAPLKIFYDELHILHIESGNTSLLSKRSAASADDIILTPGVANTVSMTFSRACNYTLYARGLFK